MAPLLGSLPGTLDSCQDREGFRVATYREFGKDSIDSQSYRFAEKLAVLT